ncbi:MAG: hypothetical protein RLZZ422_1498 [Pseudomonadota bacterium]|jgi:hypothetical protein
MKPSYLIYDCEIIKAIPPKPNEPHYEDIDYCEGWKDFAGMGISVIGAYSSITELHVFCADNFHIFQGRLDQHDVIVDFNGHNFDRNLLAANDITIDDYKHFDILRAIWKAQGLDPDEFNPRTHGGYGLDAMARANLENLTKSGNGALAPVLWQRGQVGEVIDYCLNDVHITHELFQRLLGMSGMLVNPKIPRPETNIELLDEDLDRIRDFMPRF